MKLFASFLLWVFCVGVYGKYCSRQTDCEEHECCFKMWPLSAPKCSRRKAESQSCSRMLMTSVFGNAYLFHCPCKNGLKCKFHQSSRKLGALLMSPKCMAIVEKTPDVEPELPKDPEPGPVDAGDLMPPIDGLIPDIDGVLTEFDLDERTGIEEARGTEPDLTDNSESEEEDEPGGSMPPVDGTIPEVEGPFIESDLEEMKPGETEDKEPQLTNDRESEEENEPESELPSVDRIIPDLERVLTESEENERTGIEEDGEQPDLGEKEASKDGVVPSTDGATELERSGEEKVRAAGPDSREKAEEDEEEEEEVKPISTEKDEEESAKEKDEEKSTTPEIEGKIHVEVVMDVEIPEVDEKDTEQEVNEDELPDIIPFEGE